MDKMDKQTDEGVVLAASDDKPVKSAVVRLHSSVLKAVRSGQVDLLREYLASPMHFQAPGVSRT